MSLEEEIKEDLRHIAENGRKMIGERMRLIARLHQEEFPECDHEQAFIDGIWLGIKISAEFILKEPESGFSKSTTESY